MTRGYGWLERIFAVCFLLCVGFVLLRSGIFWALACLVLGMLLLGARRIKKFTLLLFLGSFALQAAVIAVLRPPIISDFSVLYQASGMLLHGDTSFVQWDYFRIWPYQTGFVLWETLWRVVWDSPYCLRIVQALLSAGTVCLVYRMLLPHVRPAAARTAAVLLSLFPFFATFCVVLTNQISAAFFAVLACYLLTAPEADVLRFGKYPLCGLSLALSNLLRPEGIVLLAAIAGLFVFKIIRTGIKPNPKRILWLLAGAVLLFAVYFAVNFGADALARSTQLNPNGLGNGYPMWKFVCGLNHETGGSYSQADWDLLAATFDDALRPTEATHELEKALLHERLCASPSSMLTLLIQKTDKLWITDALDWATGHLNFNGTAIVRVLVDLLRRADRAFFALALALAALGVTKRGRMPEIYLFYLVFGAAFAAFLPIEVQPRYAYLPEIFLFGAAAPGIDRLFDFAERRKSKCP